MAGEKPSFWTTLPGLTGIAFLITACVGLYSVLHTNHRQGNSARANGAGRGTVVQPSRFGLERTGDEGLRGS